MPADRPHILFIHTDSMDGRATSPMGHPALAGATPALDALAARGTLFRNAYCNNPICCPSRASMMSGQYTHHCESWNNYKGLEDGDRTFFDELTDAGYRMGVIGKTDYVSGRHTQRARVSPWLRSAEIQRPSYRMGPPRVDDSHEKRVHQRDWGLFDAAGEFLRESAGGEQPFFLQVGPGLPHPEFRTSRHWLEKIDPAAVDVPGNDVTDHPVLEHQRLCKNWLHGLDEGTVRLVRRIYFAMIAEVDAMTGELLAELDRCGLADSTVVIFSSDHGELAMEHGQFYKMSPFEASARVPLIVAGPGVRAGASVETLVSLVDIYPTLTDLIGAGRPAGLDGYSLAPALAGKPTEHPGWILSESHDTLCTGTFMLRRGDWKYIVYVGQRPQLFNLADDPNELADRAATEPKVVTDMDRVLRSIVDYDAVDAKVKAYDRAAFAQWRDEHLASGDYRGLMARIFSGWDYPDQYPDDPWTDADEQIVESWLREGSA